MLCLYVQNVLFLFQEPPISAVDNDSGNNSVVTYSLSGVGSEIFKILESGQVIFNSPDPIITLDRERKERYDLQVRIIGFYVEMFIIFLEKAVERLMGTMVNICHLMLTRI